MSDKKIAKLIEEMQAYEKGSLEYRILNLRVRAELRERKLNSTKLELDKLQEQMNSLKGRLDAIGE